MSARRRTGESTSPTTSTTAVDGLTALPAGRWRLSGRSPGCCGLSASVKLLAEEEGSDLAAQLCDGCDAAVASRLAYPEVRAALAAAGRNHDLDSRQLASTERAWERLLGGHKAGRAHCRRRTTRRRAYEASRAARGRRCSPCQCPAIEDPDLIVAVWDRRLHAGARAAGLRVAPAELAPDRHSRRP
jgi:uncharacterized protein